MFPEFRSFEEVLQYVGGSEEKLSRMERYNQQQVDSAYRALPERLFGGLLSVQWYHTPSRRKEIRAAYEEVRDVTDQETLIRQAVYRYAHPIHLNPSVDGQKTVLMVGGRADGKLLAIKGDVRHYKIAVMPNLTARIAEDDELADCMPIEIDYEEYESRLWADAIMRTTEERMFLCFPKN